MINLLPVEEKQKIRSMYRSRVAVVLFSALSILFILGTVGLVPSYLSALGKYESAVIQSGAVSESGAEDETRILVERAVEINRKAGILMKERNTAPPTELLLAILHEKSAGIRITEVSYIAAASPTPGNPVKKTNTQMTLSGIADTREALLSFTNALNALGLFSSVDLPISNFVKDRNLSFSINIEVKEKTP